MYTLSFFWLNFVFGKPVGCWNCLWVLQLEPQSHFRLICVRAMNSVVSQNPRKCVARDALRVSASVLVPAGPGLHLSSCVNIVSLTFKALLELEWRVIRWILNKRTYSERDDRTQRRSWWLLSGEIICQPWLGTVGNFSPGQWLLCHSDEKVIIKSLYRSQYATHNYI